MSSTSCGPRVAALHVPNVGLQALVRRSPELAGAALALEGERRLRGRVAEASRRAREAGVGEGQTLAQARAACPGLRVLVLSARPETRSDALASGADAFVCKMDSPEKLLEAIFGAV